MKPITFCIATAKNERDYVRLLIKSLTEHTNIAQHEILVFIDSDNQDTHLMLKELKQSLPNLKICRNPNPYPIGGQRNVSVMFDQASNDIVCYLQSDMVVGKDFDKHINDNLIPNRVLACARIEPPLHPESPEKIVKDFGITPSDFQYDKFNEFVEELQAENKPNMEGHFAPFAVYKEDWLGKLGSFDTQFRCSREDSDTIIRMKLCGLETIQSWNACVYHFTCVSSRGTDWYKEDKEAVYKNQLQSLADQQELKRFIRKWGFFGHQPRPLYNIAFNVELDAFVDINVLKWIEPYCTRLYLSDAGVVSQLVSQVEFDAHYYSNLRWNYPVEYWDKVKHLFNPTNFSKRIAVADKSLEEDVVVSFKYSELMSKDLNEIARFIENIQIIVDQNPVGVFSYECFYVEIKQKNNVMDSLKKSTIIDTLLTDQSFEFI